MSNGPGTDPVTSYGFEHVYKQGSISVRCIPCGAEFPRIDGSVMRAHARKCPVVPRAYHVPGVCDS